MWDNLTALQPSTVKEAQTILFLRKLPRHIRNLIHPRAFKEPEDLIQHCNEIWEDQTTEEAAAAAAAAAPSLTLLSEAPAALPLRSAGVPPPRGRPETAEMIACVSTTISLRFQGPEVREGLLLPGKLIGRRPAHTPPLPPVLSQPASPLFFHTGISHSHVFLTYKELNFPSRLTK
jgi:hypothetical protein